MHGLIGVHPSVDQALIRGTNVGAFFQHTAAALCGAPDERELKPAGADAPLLLDHVNTKRRPIWTFDGGKSPSSAPNGKARSQPPKV